MGWDPQPTRTTPGEVVWKQTRLGTQAERARRRAGGAVTVAGVCGLVLGLELCFDTFDTFSTKQH